MIEVARIIEDQINMSSYRATLNEERAVQLEFLIELTKTKNKFADWHYLIATPFRYQPPFKNARFRPPFSTRNVFYASLQDTTAYYEYAYHMMRERLHLKITPEIGRRTFFTVDIDNTQAIHIHAEPDCALIMDKNNYDYSHNFIEKHQNTPLVIYPSCRDPKHCDNAAIFDINFIAKKPNQEQGVKYFYDNEKRLLSWIDKDIQITWNEVS